jgi:hypothetical protein
VQEQGDASSRDDVILPGNGYDRRFTFLQNLNSVLFETGKRFSHRCTLLQIKNGSIDSIINPLTTIIQQLI